MLKDRVKINSQQKERIIDWLEIADDDNIEEKLLAHYNVYSLDDLAATDYEDIVDFLGYSLNKNR